MIKPKNNPRKRTTTARVKRAPPSDGPRGSIKSLYENMFPRFLGAVTSMAAGTGSLRERLAWVVFDVLVFAESQIPKGVAGRYREFNDLVNSVDVPPGYQRHPHPASRRALSGCRR
jgi:hypothetical protein